MPARLHSSHLASMDQTTLYRMLQLRTDVFVVEQHCPYPELDGRDLEDSTLIVWASAGGSAAAVIATLRILRDPESLRIGRVVVHASQRGTGLAERMFEFALERCAEIDATLPIDLDAQEPLESWYGRFGFERTGATFLEDDIPHVPMRRAAR